MFFELFVVLLEEEDAPAGESSSTRLLPSVQMSLIVEWYDSTLVSIPSSSTG